MIEEHELTRIENNPTAWDVAPLLAYVRELQAEVERLKGNVEYAWRKFHDMEEECDAARSLLKQAVSYLGGHQNPYVDIFVREMNALFVKWADRA